MMRLFHVSEDPNITVFCPRPAEARTNVIGDVVWAVDDAHLSNYLLPRDCPRVCFTSNDETTAEDRARFGISEVSSRVVAIESSWAERLNGCKLYLYELPSELFELSDANAGYYVSRNDIQPIGVTKVKAIDELHIRSVELRLLENLWEVHDALAASTLSYSMIRMRNAAPRSFKSGTFDEH